MLIKHDRDGFQVTFELRSSYVQDTFLTIWWNENATIATNASFNDSLFESAEEFKQLRRQKTSKLPEIKTISNTFLLALQLSWLEIPGPRKYLFIDSMCDSIASDIHLQLSFTYRFIVDVLCLLRSEASKSEGS